MNELKEIEERIEMMIEKEERDDNYLLRYSLIATHRSEELRGCSFGMEGGILN